MTRLPMKMKQFCQTQKLLRLSYLDGKGYPRVVPVWFISRGNDFILGTEDFSAKWRSIRKSPNVGWVIDDGTTVKSYKGVSFWGTAKPMTDHRVQRQTFRAVGMKYFDSTEHPTLIELFGQPHSIFIRLKPEHFFCWGF